MKKFTIYLILLLPLIQISAESKEMAGKNTISGYVKDAKNGESLIGVTVYIRELNRGLTTNLYGYYSFNLQPGKYTVDYSYVGYQTTTQTINLDKNFVINIELNEEAQMLEEVVISGDRPQEKISRAEMSVEKIGAKEIKKIPAMFGEVDVIKAIQMMPGVIPTAEGTSGFSVRGGGSDQNLILLDEAPVYNASHLMGFFSVFNNDAVRDVKLYKGDIPANYGGRLSSVLDVRMKEGNSKRWSATGGIGLLSSRLTLEGPLDSAGRTSVLISGRRTYMDIFFPLFPDTNLQKSILYFYDLNMKINHQINQNNRLYISGYLGRDIFGEEGASKASFGNKTLTLRWNHQFTPILFSNVTAIASNYDYSLESKQAGAEYVWKSDLVDYSGKIDFNLYPNPENEIKFGLSFTDHAIDPCNAWITKDTTTQKFPSLKNNELEYGFYISNSQKVTEKITLKYGLRYSIFQNIGPTKFNEFDNNHVFVKTIEYEDNKIYKTYSGLEPRLGINYLIDEASSVKASYSRTYQYMQLASNSNGGMPLDYWFASSPNVKPQQADQYAIGYVRNWLNNKLETSVEVFQKQMDNVIDFRDHAVLLFNDRLEGDVRSGKARSYGAEFLIRKNDGKLNGWISYTYSRALRKVPGINDGKEYSAPYDKPHNLNIILNYKLGDRWLVSANWIYASGTPITFPVGSFKFNNNVIPIYSDRNAYRMRDYHRLDLSASYSPRKKTCLPFFEDICWQGEWVFSVYNAYGRHNDWMINFVDKELAQPDGSKIMTDTKQAQRTYLPFLFLPGITYNFVF